MTIRDRGVHRRRARHRQCGATGRAAAVAAMTLPVAAIIAWNTLANGLIAGLESALAFAVVTLVLVRVGVGRARDRQARD